MAYDLTRHNSGRMIDYWLGGEHNFEIDRQVADHIASQYPIIPESARDTRQMLKRAVTWWYERGICAFLDFGSALPTIGNTHLVAQSLDPNCKVVYSDIDPLTVAYAQEILRDTPNVIYLQCDAANPRPALDSPRTQQLLGNERRVGIVFQGLAHFISDEQIRSSWQTLYDWAAPDSYMIVSVTSPEWDTDPILVATTKMFIQSNVMIYNRSLEQLLDLLAPWQMTEEGVALNGTWGLPPISPPPFRVGQAMMLRKPK